MPDIIRDTLKKRMDEAEKDNATPYDPKKGKDAGDIPGPNADFFKARSKEARSGPPAELLKKHYNSK